MHALVLGNRVVPTIGRRVHGGTSGSALFVDANGNLAQDNGNLFWDDTNNRLGVGTASPGATFTVAGGPTGTSMLVGGGTAAFGGTPLDANAILIASVNANDPTATTTGANFSKTLALTAANAQAAFGGTFTILSQPGGAAHNMTGEIRGGKFAIEHWTSATMSNVAAGQLLVYNISTGTIASAVGALTEIQNLNAAGVITNAYGVRVTLPFNSGTITNTYGVYIDDLTAGTQTNQAYGLYQADANCRNYFAGNLSLDKQLIVNETGADVDCRIEGDTDTNLIYTDASTDRVGVGTATPATKLDVNGTVTCTTIDTGNGAVELAAGKYTPGLTNVANIASSTAYECQYIRVGSIVTVSGKVDVDATTNATQTQLGIDLPIASNLGAEEDCSGSANPDELAIRGAAIKGDPTNNRAEMAWLTATAAAVSYFFTFTYEII